MKNNKLFVVGCSLFGLMVYAQSQADDIIERSWDFGIGIGYGNQSNPFVGADDVPNYLTLDIAIYGKRFFFDNGDLGFTLVDQTKMGVNLIASYSSERIYYSYFNELGILTEPGATIGAVQPTGLVSLAGLSGIAPQNIVSLELPDRDFAISLGLELLWNTSFGDIQVQANQDVSNTHNGGEVLLEYNKGWGSNRWQFQSSMGVEWKSSGLINYYYGLSNQSSTIDFSYQGESTVNMFVGFLINYRISNHLNLVTNFRYKSFGSGITNSPLIEDGYTQSVFTGFFYSF
ncbi:MAG: MipA/OmpV family protein [Proteobacteria bacterium]|nr:MipA/OmpV family protein [Pseudomonadota bacterium]